MFLLDNAHTGNFTLWMRVEAQCRRERVGAKGSWKSRGVTWKCGKTGVSWGVYFVRGSIFVIAASSFLLKKEKSKVYNSSTIRCSCFVLPLVIHSLQVQGEIGAHHIV